MKLDDSYVGKIAYKKSGLYGGLVGRIEKSNHSFIPYCIEFATGRIGITNLNDIVLVEEEDEDS